jgi:hypothetical protein
MDRNTTLPAGRRSATTYRLQVRGPLPALLAASLDGFTVDAGPTTTTLTGPIADAAALYGLIARLEALGLTLISVGPTDAESTAPLPIDHDITHQRQDHDDA